MHPGSGAARILGARCIAGLYQGNAGLYTAT